MSTPAANDDPAADALDLGILPGLVGYRLRRAQVRVYNSFAARLGERGLTSGQFGVLVLVAANPGSSQSALARALGTNRSLMVRAIDRLENGGLVTRASVPGDRRSHAIELTAKGARRIAALEAEVRAHEARVTKGLSAAEIETLLELLGRLGGDGPA